MDSYDFKEYSLSYSIILYLSLIIALALFIFVITRIIYDDKIENNTYSINNDDIEIDQDTQYDNTSLQIVDRTSGKTDKYSWLQNSEEMILIIPINKDIKTKNVIISIKSKSLIITILNELYLSKDFYDTVIPSESTWHFDTSDVSISNTSANNESHNRVIEITLIKKYTANKKDGILLWPYPFKHNEEQTIMQHVSYHYGTYNTCILIYATIFPYYLLLYIY